MTLPAASEIRFTASEHMSGGFRKLKAAFNEAYRTHLLNPASVFIVTDQETLTVAQHEACNDIRIRLNRQARQGSSSFIATIKAIRPGGHQCNSLKCHALYAPREIIGIFEKWAAKSKDRCVWIGSETSWEKIMRKGRAGNKGFYNRAQRWRAIRFLESLGWLIPVFRESFVKTAKTRKPKRVVIRGWRVAKHADLAKVENGKCCIDLSSLNPFPETKRGKRRQRLNLSALDDTSRKSRCDFPETPMRLRQNADATSHVTRCDFADAQATESMKVIASGEEQILPIPVKSSQFKESQLKTSQAIKELHTNRDGKNLKPPHAFQDADLTNGTKARARKRLTFKTLYGFSPTLVELSGGLFEEKFLARYPHREVLDKCLLQAYDEFLDRPYEGSRSNALLIGRIMDLLKDKYGVSAPKGFTPILRKLRAGEGEILSIALEPEDEILAFELFTHFHSVFHLFGPECAALDPNVKQELISLAEELGVPRIYQEGEDFLAQYCLHRSGDRRVCPKVVELFNIFTDRASEVRQNLAARQ